MAILPFIEAGNVMTLYSKQAFWMDSVANVSFRAANLPFMRCPSDGYSATPFDGLYMTAAATPWARGCYAANGTVSVDGTNMVPGGAGWGGYNSSAWANLNNRGVMCPDVALSMKQITDGTSKTVIVSELRADPDPNGMRGVWGLQSAASATYAHGSNIVCHNGIVWSDVGPNNPGDASLSGGTQSASGDRFGNCANDINMLTLVNMGMGCVNDSATGVMGPKSLHPGGVQTVFCDGSVHWVDNSIQCGNGQATGVATNIGYYEMLYLSSDGNNVPQDVFNAN